MEAIEVRRGLALLEPVASFLPILVAVIVSLSLVLLGVQAGQVSAAGHLVLALQRLNVRLGGIANSWNALSEQFSSSGAY